MEEISMMTLLIVRDKNTGHIIYSERTRKRSTKKGREKEFKRLWKKLREEYPADKYSIQQSTAPDLETHLQAFPEDR